MSNFDVEESINKSIYGNKTVYAYVDDVYFDHEKLEKLSAIIEIFKLDDALIVGQCIVDTEVDCLSILKLLEGKSEITNKKKKETTIAFTINRDLLISLLRITTPKKYIITADCYLDEKIIARLVIDDIDGSCFCCSANRLTKDEAKHRIFDIIKK